MILVPLFVRVYVEIIHELKYVDYIMTKQTKNTLSRGGLFHDERHVNLLHYVCVKLILRLSLKTRNITRII